MFSSKPVLALMILGVFSPGSAQNLLDRLRPAPVNLTRIDDIKVVSGTKVKRYERLTVPLGGVGPVLGGIGAAALLTPLLSPQPAYLGYAYVGQRIIRISWKFRLNYIYRNPQEIEILLNSLESFSNELPLRYRNGRLVPS